MTDADDLEMKRLTETILNGIETINETMIITDAPKAHISLLYVFLIIGNKPSFIHSFNRSELENFNSVSKLHKICLFRSSETVKWSVRK